MSTTAIKSEGPSIGTKGARRHEQSQHEEEDDLAEPSKSIERLVDDLSGTVSVPAEDEACQVNGQKPACASSLGTAKEGCGTGERQNGASTRLTRASSK